MTTRSRARHFHATAKALTNAAALRVDGEDMVLTAQVADVDIQSIIAGAGGIDATSMRLDVPIELPVSAMAMPTSAMTPEALLQMHEELRWAESKLMQASERLAEAQEARRKDLVALAVMRRELLGSFAAERSWLNGAMQWFGDIRPALAEREAELAALVDGGVRTAQVIQELAAVRAERALFDLAIVQSKAQVARVDDNETSSEYQVASEAYEREPDGASMRELARLRALSTRNRREAVRMRDEAKAGLDEFGIVRGMGEVTAVNAFLAAEYEGDQRAAERMDRVRQAQFELELSRLPEAEANFKAAIKHPVQFMRARRTIG